MDNCPYAICLSSEPDCDKRVAGYQNRDMFWPKGAKCAPGMARVGMKECQYAQQDSLQTLRTLCYHFLLECSKQHRRNAGRGRNYQHRLRIALGDARLNTGQVPLESCCARADQSLGCSAPVAKSSNLFGSGTLTRLPCRAGLS